MTNVDSAIKRVDAALMKGVPPAAWSWAQDAATLAAEVKRLRLLHAEHYRRGYLDGYEDGRLERDARFQR